MAYISSGNSDNILQLPLPHQIMCFNLGYNFKNGKFVRVKKVDDGDDDGDEELEDQKGLLSKEILRWRKQHDALNTQVEEAKASSFPSKLSKCSHHSPSSS